MIISLNWLRDYVDLDIPVEELASRLTMTGLEIESVQPLYPLLSNVIVARLDSFSRHPDADRLSICEVSDGTRTYNVVCGAPNLAAGSQVALALPGATVASGMTVAETRIRGVASQGMLCSRKELGTGEDASGIWILPVETPLGVPLGEVLGFDTILDISITPNRGDCLSTIGIAREVAAITGSTLRYPSYAVSEGGQATSELASVTIEDPVGCPRYAARLIRGLAVGPSPQWLRRRIEAIGLRSINNIVDVTNFIMMELGQPLHAFDFEKLRERRIVVRKATEGQRFTTLDGVERKLFDDTLLICDGVGPVAIAGIMGGLDSEITQSSRQVLIESAYFDPTSIRRTGKRLGLRSESSYRFERGIDIDGVTRALDRAAQLMLQVGGGEVTEGRIDVYPGPRTVPGIAVRVENVNRFLGIETSASEISDVLTSLEMQVHRTGGETLEVIPPAFRHDISREVDLAEEVARIIGYDKIPVTYPVARLSSSPIDEHQRARQDTKAILCAAGFYEVLNYSFVSMDSLQKLRLPAGDVRLRPVQVMNPLSEEQAVMRTTLLPGLITTALVNYAHSNDDLRIFELSKVFLSRAGEMLPEEPHHLGGLMSGRRNPDPLYGGEDLLDYTDIKGAVELVLARFYPNRVDYSTENIPPFLDPFASASVLMAGEHIGVVGKLHPEVQVAFDLKRDVHVFEIDFDLIFRLQGQRPGFTTLPRYPAIRRDMALVVDQGVAVGKILEFIEGFSEPLLEELEIFDIYRNQLIGDNMKSVGYRLVYRSADRSLTDEEVNAIHSAILGKVLEEFNATLR